MTVGRGGTPRLASHWVDVQGRRVHARVAASSAPPGALPVVLVHGAVISGSYMVPTAARLARDHPVWVPDLPGYGRSDGPPRALDVPALADALASFLDATGLSRVALLGNSLGCQVVADLAARRPERVACLVLVGPTVDPAHRTVPEQLVRLLLDVPHERPSLLGLQAMDYARAGVRRAMATYRIALADRIEEKLPRVLAPTLVVRGGRDPLVTRRWAEQVVRLLPTARLVEIPASGHAVNYSRPDALVEVVRPFLAGVERAPAR